MIMNLSIFDQLALFHDLDAQQRAIIRPLFSEHEEPAGAIIFEQGAPAKHLYLVVDGEVNVRYKPDDGPAMVVARVRADGVAGWSAALGTSNYTSSAVCANDCNADDLRWLCETYPELGQLVLDRLAVVIAKRLKNTHQHVVALLQHGLRIDTGYTTLPADMK